MVSEAAALADRAAGQGITLGCTKGRPLRVNNAITDRVAGEIAQGMEIEFVHDIASVCFRSVNADAQHGSHLFVALAFR